MSGKKRKVRSISEMEQQREGWREIRHLQQVFASNRELGIYTSPYPQQGYSPSLGVTVREVRETHEMIRLQLIA